MKGKKMPFKGKPVAKPSLTKSPKMKSDKIK